MQHIPNFAGEACQSDIVKGACDIRDDCGHHWRMSSATLSKTKLHLSYTCFSSVIQQLAPPSPWLLMAETWGPCLIPLFSLEFLRVLSSLSFALSCQSPGPPCCLLKLSSCLSILLLCHHYATLLRPSSVPLVTTVIFQLVFLLQSFTFQLFILLPM